MTIHLSFLFLLALFAINAVECVIATPLSETATIHTRFTSTKNPKVSIRFVTNSGVCETTPGVQQISGYVDFGKNMSMVSISFLLNIIGQSLIWEISGSGSLSHEILRKRLLSHFGLSYTSLVCEDSRL